jgi:hypothetical protein
MIASSIRLRPTGHKTLAMAWPAVTWVTCWNRDAGRDYHNRLIQPDSGRAMIEAAVASIKRDTVRQGDVAVNGNPMS